MPATLAFAFYEVFGVVFVFLTIFFLPIFSPPYILMHLSEAGSLGASSDLTTSALPSDLCLLTMSTNANIAGCNVPPAAIDQLSIYSAFPNIPMDFKTIWRQKLRRKTPRKRRGSGSSNNGKEASEAEVVTSVPRAYPGSAESYGAGHCASDAFSRMEGNGTV